MIATIVKIDICKSKKFASQREHFNPSVRTDALKKLLEVSQRCFPMGSDSYPDGSFYKADGDAVYYIVEKPSVGLRGAIEFMQSWYHEGLTEYPECRSFLDRGYIEPLPVPGKMELTGKPFENISAFEKGLDEGKIYLTNDMLNSVDQTMAKFVFYCDVTPRPSESLRIYSVDFLDPRTVTDSSLIHALFVAHPKAAEARSRLFELFIVEYLLEHETLNNVEEVKSWAEAKNYPLPMSNQIHKIIKASSFLEKGSDGFYRLRFDAKNDLEAAQKDFTRAQVACISEIEASVSTTTGRNTATKNLPLQQILDEYLCAIFAEIRMMANYFRSTLHLFDVGPEQFARFDYVLKRHLDEQRLAYFDEWRRGFISGLKSASEKGNLYIAAVFHNVLATYYLNRAGQASPYQLDKLRKRRILLDTNVLYSLLVPASQFHEMTNYFVKRLAKMGIQVRVFPISLNEYEEALAFVERNWDLEGPNDIIVHRNPWLYQEYMRDPAPYLNSIAVCREKHSVAKGLPVLEENFEEIEKKLKAIGISLEKEWVLLSDEEVESLWLELRNSMTSSAWSAERYWEFIYKDFPPEVIRHDMICIASLEEKAKKAMPDALGPRVLFVTVDSKLYRLHPRYQFMVTPEQFLEFMLPYLFLSDIPVADAERFPNQLLSAQLGTLLVCRPPELAEIVGAYFRNPELARKDAAKEFPAIGEDMAKALNSQRFRELVVESKNIPDSQKQEVRLQTTEVLEEFLKKTRHADEDRKMLKELKQQIAERDFKITKLQKTVGYWRAEARRH